MNTPPSTIPCPQCHQPTIWEGNEHRPFCSERCRLMDLGAWIDGQYRVPAQAIMVNIDLENNQ